MHRNLALIQKIAKGDAQAFEEYYKESRQKTVELCQKMKVPAAEIDDVVSSIYSKLWEIHEKLLSNIGNLTSYVGAVMRNAITDYQRNHLRPLQQLRFDDYLLKALRQELKQEASFAHNPEYDQLALLIQHTIDHLPEKQQQVLICNLQGLSAKETAAQLGRKVGAVNRSLYKAREKIMSAIKIHNSR
jgi:RNA polymerase sigma factor (sigma-70 family)